MQTDRTTPFFTLVLEIHTYSLPSGFFAILRQLQATLQHSTSRNSELEEDLSST